MSTKRKSSSKNIQRRKIARSVPWFGAITALVAILNCSLFKRFFIKKETKFLFWKVEAYTLATWICIAVMGVCLICGFCLLLFAKDEE